MGVIAPGEKKTIPMAPVHHPLTQLFADPERKIGPVMMGGDERWKIRGVGGYDKDGKEGEDEEEKIKSGKDRTA